MTTPAKAAREKTDHRPRPGKAAAPDARRSGKRAGPAPKPSPACATPAVDGVPGARVASPGATALTRAQAIRELADRANRGSAQALANLRRLLDDCPEVWEHVGDLARHAEAAWLDLVAGEDHLMRESVKRQLEKMKDDLAGLRPTLMEELLVNQVVTCHLAVQHAEMSLAAPGSTSPAQTAIRLRRSESAQRRYLSALKTLARLRATVPEGMAPLNSLRLHPGERRQA